MTAPSKAVREYLAKLGKKGGAAGKGAAKARSSEQAAAAVNARWARVRAERESKGLESDGKDVV